MFLFLRPRVLEIFSPPVLPSYPAGTTGNGPWRLWLPTPSSWGQWEMGQGKKLQLCLLRVGPSQDPGLGWQQWLPLWLLHSPGAGAP